jgi:hypothetical protein
LILNFKFSIKQSVLKLYAQQTFKLNKVDGTLFGLALLSVAEAKENMPCGGNLLITGVAAAGLSFAVADVHAQNIETQAGANVDAGTHRHGVTTRSRAALHARAQVRGPDTTAPGWRDGRKVGWHCGNPPRLGCKPPGLR